MMLRIAVGLVAASFMLMLAMQIEDGAFGSSVRAGFNLFFGIRG